MVYLESFFFYQPQKFDLFETLIFLHHSLFIFPEDKGGVHGEKFNLSSIFIYHGPFFFFLI